MFSNFLNTIQNLSLKKKIIIIAIPVVIISSIILINSFKRNTKQEEVVVDNPKVEEKVVIPDVNESNTKISLSSKEEVENVTITVEDQLDDYTLYYYIKTNAAIEMEEEKEKNEVEVEFDDTSDNSYTKYNEPIIIEENSKIFFAYEKGGNYSEKDYVLNIDNIVKKLQETEEVSEEQLKKEKVSENKVVTGSAAYYIRVNYGANVVTIYGKDDEGNYTKPVKAMICSCGRATPTGGVYKTSRGYDWGALIGGVYGQYSTRIVGSILFHSVPYTARSKDSLEYWEFDKLGTKASAGCVRLQVVDAKWIFNNCGSGVMVEFYSSSDPGPLGKPSAPKISGNERCRNWDPTDYVSGNPWLDKNANTNAQPKTESETKPINNSQADNTHISTNNENVANNIVNSTIEENTITNEVVTNNTIIENTVVNDTTIEDTTLSSNDETTITSEPDD